MEEHVLGVIFVQAGEYPAGVPSFTAQQLPHWCVRVVGGHEHPGCRGVLECGPDESASDSLLSQAVLKEADVIYALLQQPVYDAPLSLAAVVEEIA